MRLETQDIYRHRLRHLPATLVFDQQANILRHKVVVRRGRRQGLPGGAIYVLAVERGVFFLAQAIQVGMVDAGQAGAAAFCIGPAHKQANGHALLDVEHVVVLAAAGRFFFLFAVAVQVEQVDVVKALHQALAHAAKGGVVQVAVVGDKGQHAVAGALDAPLRKADELDVVVVEPFGVALGKFLAIHRKVVARGAAALAAVHAAQQVGNPLAGIGRMPRIRRVAQHHHDRRVALDVAGRARFFGQPLGEQRQAGEFVRFFERVGQKNAQALVAGKVVAAGFEREAQLHVRHGVRSHEQLKPEQARQQVLGHVAGPGAVVADEVLANLLNDGVQESAGSGGRVEDLQAVRFVVHVAGFALFHQIGRGRHFDGGLAGMGQPFGHGEVFFQERIDAAHDVAHHRLGGVVHAARLAHGGVIGGQEGFVEVDDGVFLPGAAAKGFENGAHVGAGQQLRQLIHGPGDAVVQVGAGNLVKQLAQERVGFGQLAGGALPGKARACGVAAGRKQAVAQGLRVHVGKLCGCEGVEQHGAKRLQLAVQFACVVFGRKGFFNQFANQPPHAGHARGQIVRRGLERNIGLDELAQKLPHLAGGGVIPFDLAVLVGLRQAGAELELAIQIPLELDVIG